MLTSAIPLLGELSVAASLCPNWRLCSEPRLVRRCSAPANFLIMKLSVFVKNIIWVL